MTREESGSAASDDGRGDSSDEDTDRGRPGSEDDGKGATARVLVGLTLVAGLVALLGVGAVWAFAYGPLA